MLLLVSGATATVRRYAGTGLLGHLLTPRNWNTVSVETGLPWAIDNGAFRGFDPGAFQRCLARWRGRPGCLFAVCPDVVGDARATLARFGEWAERVRGHGYPVAYVGQDGERSERVPWGDFAAWFVGGSTGWKLSAQSRALALEAKRRGKWLHMGRVNTRRRFAVAWDWGCDSVDGSGFSVWPDARIPLGLRWLRELRTQGVLF